MNRKDPGYAIAAASQARGEIDSYEQDLLTEAGVNWNRQQPLGGLFSETPFTYTPLDGAIDWDKDLWYDPTGSLKDTAQNAVRSTAEMAHAIATARIDNGSPLDLYSNDYPPLPPTAGAVVTMACTEIGCVPVPSVAAVGTTPWNLTYSTGSGDQGQTTGQNDVSNILMPDGQFVGTVNQGATPNIRTVPSSEFDTLKDSLLNGATESGTYAGGKGTWYDLPSGGRVGVRTSDNAGPTLDIDIPGYPKGFKVHQQ